MVAWISGFASTARSLTGQDPIIYTTADWWGACTGGSTVFGADPMWVAAYGFSRPPLPAGWTTYSYWQNTSGGTVPGVDSPGTTDLDTFSPSAVALIDPGTLASRPLARVTAAIQSLGALAGENLTWTASGLPPGLGITALGVLTGVITNPPANEARSPVTYEPTVTARNAAGGASTVTFDWQVAATCPDYLTFSVCPGPLATARCGRIEPGGGAGGLVGELRQVLVDGADRGRALADGGGDPLHRPDHPPAWAR
jgi:Glycosyl hydrolases family 25/Putative Ig domain